jgi:glucose-6-phosphate 1-dehydrogenase
MGPDTAIAIGATVLAAGRPGLAEHVELYACRDRTRQVEEYELLLGAAIAGDHLLFARQDEVEEAWRIVDPLLADPAPLQAYEPGSWGPAAADALIAPHGRWDAPRGA